MAEEQTPPESSESADTQPSPTDGMPAPAKRARGKELSPQVTLIVIVIALAVIIGVGYQLTFRPKGPTPPGPNASKAEVATYMAYMMKHRTDKR